MVRQRRPRRHHQQRQADERRHPTAGLHPGRPRGRHRHQHRHRHRGGRHGPGAARRPAQQQPVRPDDGPAALEPPRLCLSRRPGPGAQAPLLRWPEQRRPATRPDAGAVRARRGARARRGGDDGERQRHRRHRCQPRPRQAHQRHPPPAGGATAAERRPRLRARARLRLHRIPRRAGGRQGTLLLSRHRRSEHPAVGRPVRAHRATGRPRPSHRRRRHRGGTERRQIPARRPAGGDRR